MGPYDNETGVYGRSEEWDDGQWLVDEDGALYVIPQGADDVEGPEGDLATRMLELLRDGGQDILTAEQIERLGMTEVPDVLRRFDPETGYHSA